MAGDERQGVQRDGLLGHVPVAIVKPLTLAEVRRDPLQVHDQHPFGRVLSQRAIELAREGIAAALQPCTEVTERFLGTQGEEMLHHRRIGMQPGCAPQGTPALDFPGQPQRRLLARVGESQLPRMRRDDDVAGLEPVERAGPVEELLPVLVVTALEEDDVDPLPEGGESEQGPKRLERVAPGQRDSRLAPGQGPLLGGQSRQHACRPGPLDELVGGIDHAREPPEGLLPVAAAVIFLGDPQAQAGIRPLGIQCGFKISLEARPRDDHHEPAGCGFSSMNDCSSPIVASSCKRSSS